jgi:hypothetical protein
VVRVDAADGKLTFDVQPPEAPTETKPAEPVLTE